MFGGAPVPAGKSGAEERVVNPLVKSSQDDVSGGSAEAVLARRADPPMSGSVDLGCPVSEVSGSPRARLGLVRDALSGRFGELRGFVTL
jgi:hypothetical protein